MLVIKYGTTLLFLLTSVFLCNILHSWCSVHQSVWLTCLSAVTVCCAGVSWQIAQEKLYEHWRVNSPDIRQVSVYMSQHSLNREAADKLELPTFLYYIDHILSELEKWQAERLLMVLLSVLFRCSTCTYVWFPFTRQHLSCGDWRLRGNIIRAALCWIVWDNVHSQRHIYVSSSYRSNRLSLSHWDPYAVRRGGCLV